jgi:hypothetical protein
MSGYPHQSPLARYNFIADFVNSYSANCVFHLLIPSSETLSPHSSLSDCDADLAANSGYRDLFRSIIHFESTACYRCGCPTGVSKFGHGPGYAKNCNEVELQEFLRPLAYIVIHSPELRGLVFSFLSIDPTPFMVDEGAYALWLGMKSSGKNRVASNLLEVVYAVAVLFDNDTSLAHATFSVPTCKLFFISSQHPLIPQLQNHGSPHKLMFFTIASYLKICTVFTVSHVIPSTSALCPPNRNLLTYVSTIAHSLSQ